MARQRSEEECSRKREQAVHRPYGNKHGVFKEQKGGLCGCCKDNEETNVRLFIYSFIKYVRGVPEAEKSESQLFGKLGRERKEGK